MNADLVVPASQLGKDFLTTTSEMYDLFNVVVNSLATEYSDYIIIKDFAWQILKQKYPNAITIKRICFLDQTTFFNKVETLLPMVILPNPR